MKSNDIGYYIVNPIRSRPLKVVMKGLPIDYDPEEIKNNLKTLGHKVEKVTQLRRFMDRRPLPIFQIQITQGPNVDEIFKITSFNYLSVVVDKFEKSGRVNQCFSSQNFFHSSETCHLKPRCVKCGLDHDSRNCTKDDKTTPTCANCNCPPPASYRGCKLFPKWDKRQTLDAQCKMGDNPKLPKLPAPHSQGNTLSGDNTITMQTKM